jgi:hypothetical protein
MIELSRMPAEMASAKSWPVGDLLRVEPLLDRQFVQQVADLAYRVVVVLFVQVGLGVAEKDPHRGLHAIRAIAGTLPCPSN